MGTELPIYKIDFTKAKRAIAEAKQALIKVGELYPHVVKNGDKAIVKMANLMLQMQKQGGGEGVNESSGYSLPEKAKKEIFDSMANKPTGREYPKEERRGRQYDERTADEYADETMAETTGAENEELIKRLIAEQMSGQAAGQKPDPSFIQNLAANPEGLAVLLGLLGAGVGGAGSKNVLGGLLGGLLGGGAGYFGPKALAGEKLL
ncbi:MAG: hypothetical protein ABIH48_02935 [Candidatus Falkowbacteria bacterium]